MLETLLLAGFWASGQVPFEGAFDRRAAEADLLLMVLSSLPALLAGALLVSGDHEDGMTAFYRSCRLGPVGQVSGTGAALVLVLGGALAASVVLSLGLTLPRVLLTASPWITLGFALFSTAVHVAWGLFLGAASRSRLEALAWALVFWVVTVFAAEALITALVPLLPTRLGLPLLGFFLLTDPSELVRIASVVARGQSWAYGPIFQEALQLWLTPRGTLAFTVVVASHLLAPLGAAVWFVGRRSR